MPYVPTQAPAGMKEFDELRRWTEEEFRRLARATAEYDAKFKTLDAFLKANAYSEGVYTPVLSASGGTIPTFTATALSGKWIKLGRVCFVNVTASNTAGGTPGAGTFQLSFSLPFAVNSTSLGARRLMGAYTNGGTVDLVFGDFLAGGTTSALFKQTVAGSNTAQANLNCVDFNNVTRSLSWLASYPVN